MAGWAETLRGKRLRFDHSTMRSARPRPGDLGSDAKRLRPLVGQQDERLRHPASTACLQVKTSFGVRHPLGVVAVGAATEPGVEHLEPGWDQAAMLALERHAERVADEGPEQRAARSVEQ